MVRQARIVVPGYIYHVTQRGNYKQDIFLHEDDFKKYFHCINFYSQKWSMQVLACCLMRNHVHLIVIPKKQNSMALAIGQAHMEYSKYFNEKLHRAGHLWQGRFFSCLLDSRHLMAAVRYVECNPVRSGLVLNAWEWQWSSARYHMGLGRAPLNLGDIHQYFDVVNWGAYLSGRDDEKIIELLRSSTRQGRIVGDQEFIEEIETVTSCRMIKRPRGRPKKMTSVPILNVS